MREIVRECARKRSGVVQRARVGLGSGSGHDKDTHLSLAVNISIMLESSVEILKMHWDGHQIISAHVSPNDVK